MYDLVKNEISLNVPFGIYPLSQFYPLPHNFQFPISIKLLRIFDVEFEYIVYLSITGLWARTGLFLFIILQHSKNANILSAYIFLRNYLSLKGHRRSLINIFFINVLLCSLKSKLYRIHYRETHTSSNVS